MNIKNPLDFFHSPSLMLSSILIFVVSAIFLIFLLNNQESSVNIVKSDIDRSSLDSVGEITSQDPEIEPTIWNNTPLEEAESHAPTVKIQPYQSINDLLEQPDVIEELDRAINAMSRDEIIDYISSMTSYSEDELSTFSDIRQFAKKLSRLGAVGDADKYNSHLAIYGEIIFSNSNVWPMGQDLSTATFPGDANKIFAMLPRIENIGKAVFVRWYKNGEEYPLLFNKYGVDQGIPRNHIWIESSKGWSPGTYKIDIYTDDEYLEYLATGSYQILPAE